MRLLVQFTQDRDKRNGPVTLKLRSERQCDSLPVAQSILSLATANESHEKRNIEINVKKKEKLNGSAMWVEPSTVNGKDK